MMPKLNERAIIARLNQKILDESGYGRNHPEMIALGELESNDSLRRPAEHCRYPRMYAPYDEKMPVYNANQVYPGVWTGEGPAKSDSRGVRYDNVLRFVQSIFFNEHTAFTHIVALGSEFDAIQEGFSFYPYFRNIIEEQDSHKISLDEGYTLKSKKSALQFTELATYHLKAHSDCGEDKHLGLTHFPTMQDMGSLHGSPIIIARLLWLAELIKKETVFIHCSAGLGRSGTITYALMLFHDYLHLNCKKEDDLIDDLFMRFNALNKARPGSIQVSAQLKNALDIAEAMHQLQEKLLGENQSLDDFIADCLRKEKAKSPLARLAETGYESDDESSADEWKESAVGSVENQPPGKVSMGMFAPKPPRDEEQDYFSSESIFNH